MVGVEVVLVDVLLVDDELDTLEELEVDEVAELELEVELAEEPLAMKYAAATRSTIAIAAIPA